MKPLLFKIFSALWLAIAMPSLAAPQSEIARIKKSGVLRVAFSPEETPPFIYKRGDQRVGLDAELVQAMAEKLQVKLEWVQSDSSYAGIFDLLGKNRADLGVSDLFPTLDRLSQAQFSHSYLQIKQVLYVQRFKASKLKLPDQYPELIARTEMVYGYYPDAGFADGLLKHSITAKWVAYEEVQPAGKTARERMVGDFIKGDLTAVWIDELELSKWRKLRSDIDLYGFTVAIPEGEISVSVAVKPEAGDLLAWVNLFIDYAKRGDP